MNRVLLMIMIGLFLLTPFSLAIPNEQTISYDLVIKNGRVINPETNFDRIANIGLIKGKISAVTMDVITGKQEIDATGLIVVPGFIDLLSYDPNPVGVWNKLADGITTNLGMHGTTAYPEQWFSRFDKQGLPLHYGGSFFYTQARIKFGLSRYQTANQKQIEALYQIGEKAIRNGCLGISISLEYVPGISAAECLSMMRLAQKHNMAVFYHIRYSDMEEPGTNFDALNEIIGYAKETGAAIHIDHINSTGGTYSMKESLSLLDKARAKDLDITACAYPYNYWATYLNSARFDPGWQSRFHITYQDLQLGGSSERLTKESFAYYQKQGKLANAFAIPEDDIRETLRCPWVMMGSDGILEPGYNNHPRASGMSARLIGHYVRDQKVLSLMDAVAKLTILPAKRLEPQVPALKQKGRIAVGADADIVVFNYDQIIDRATPEHPEEISGGIEYVLVGGNVVKDPNGFYKNIRNGRAIKSEFIPAKFSKRMVLWKERILPGVFYRDLDYIDIGWLIQMGYQLETGKTGRKIIIKPFGTPVNLVKPDLVPPPIGEGELVLERGFYACFKEQTQTLVSIGERHFIPVATLKLFGIELEEKEETIRIKSIPTVVQGKFDNYYIFWQENYRVFQKNCAGLYQNFRQYLVSLLQNRRFPKYEKQT